MTRRSPMQYGFSLALFSLACSLPGAAMAQSMLTGFALREAPLRTQPMASFSGVSSSGWADPGTGSGAGAAAAGASAVSIPSAGYSPMSSFAVTVKASTTGIGLDVATALSRHFGIRTGDSYFGYNTSFTDSGLNITGSLHLQGASASLDIFPFHNSFRISPGITYNNKNRMDATLLVPGGQSFSLGDGGNYTSDPSNPIHGTASFVFGNSFAPRLTMGVGSILPRFGRVSFPLEMGVQYTAAPQVKLAITGNSCGNQTQSDGSTSYGCGSVDQTNVAQEQSELQNDISPLRFYPIVSLGVSFRFGRSAVAR